jgi:hypothetical protein
MDRRISYRCILCQGPGLYDCFSRTNALNHLHVFHCFGLWDLDEAMESRVFAQYFSAREFNSVTEEMERIVQ